MKGILINETHFYPDSSVLCIDFESSTLWVKNYDETLVDKCWSHYFTSIKTVELQPEDIWYRASDLIESIKLKRAPNENKN